MTKDEALKMAIDVLQNYAQADSPVWRKALNACKEALQSEANEQDNHHLGNILIFKKATKIILQSGVSVVATWDEQRESCEIVIKPIETSEQSLKDKNT